jgi:hypothetical protein
VKFHKLEVYVFDFEEYGADDIIMSLEDARNCCITVQDSQTVDIPWTDDHILNKAGTPVEVFRSFFGTELKND